MAKSPFTKKTAETYVYPAPLDAPPREGELPLSHETRKNAIDPEVIEDGGERPWIKIRIPKARGDVDAVADATQSLVVLGDNGGGAKLEQAIQRGNRALFELLVEGWSFEREATSAAYAELDTWSGEWISACLADAVRQGTDRDFAKKRNSSSAPVSSEPSSSEPAPEVLASS